MRKLSAVLFALLLCLALALPAAAEEAVVQPVNSALLLGAWEAEFEEYGVIRVFFAADGIGTTYVGDVAAASFAYMSQGDVYAALSMEEGHAEMATMEYPDEDTLRLTSDEGFVEYKRTETSEATELSLENPFLGKWAADIPSAGAVITFEFLEDGSYQASMGDQSFGTFAYMVLENMLVTFEGGELCEYTFEVVDENNIDVTEDGQVARFTRVEA